MGMVPVGSILSSLPAVCPTVAWLDRLLRQARDTVRPRSTLLFNAVEMDRGVEGHVIVHNDLDPISIVGFQSQHSVSKRTSTSSPWSNRNLGPGN
jgi:hypothetical protein